MELRLPLIARLTLVALGSTGSQHDRRPIDPVAAWVVHQQPDLAPPDEAVAAFTTIRARTDILDEMLHEEAHRARRLGERLALWTVGGGFDARWYRLLPQISDVVDSVHEVEIPELMALKASLMAASPYAEQWARVQRQQIEMTEWRVEPTGDSRPLILLEGLAGRMNPKALRGLLRSLAASAPSARILLGLPAQGSEPGTWSQQRMHRLGWQIDSEVRLAPRGRLMGKDGAEICTGMHGMRVLRLMARK